MAKTLGKTGVVVMVDETQVVHLMNRVMSSVSSASLQGFMQERAWPHFRNRILERFGSEGDKASGDWPSLSPVTVRIKKWQGSEYPDHPNVRTGSMFGFLTESHAVRSLGGGGAELSFPDNPSGLMAVKIKVAQTGDWRPNLMIPNARPAPPRPVVAIDSTDTLAIIKELSTHIVKAASAGGALSWV